MAKTSAWVFTLVGILTLPPVMTWFAGAFGEAAWWWTFSILFLIVGITKLVRSYSKHKRR